ncbi:MAG: hypothetical protein IMY73_02150 [Bacteroidetes bacterium]|nr:hypothetical protein [Bacteroidota bacterium]
MKNLIPIALTLVILLFSSCSETQTNNYATFDKYANSKNFEKGWIPSFVPKDAHNISETHNIDNNIIFGKFSFTNRTLINGFVLNSDKISNDSLQSIISSITTPSKPTWFKTDAKRPLIGKANNFIIICDTTNLKLLFLHQ